MSEFDRDPWFVTVMRVCFFLAMPFLVYVWLKGFAVLLDALR